MGLVILQLLSAALTVIFVLMAVAGATGIMYGVVTWFGGKRK